MNNTQHFETYGCVRIEQFIDLQTIAIVSQYFKNKIHRGEWVECVEKEGTTSKFFYYADPLTEVILLAVKPAVENVVGKELIPTYSYARVYQPGEELKVHTDRRSCEISVTVNVLTSGGSSPIYTQYKNNTPETHSLNPGDVVIYKGCEVKHWRLPLAEGQLNVQFMLHYVDKYGENTAYAVDTRPAYGFSSDTRSI